MEMFCKTVYGIQAVPLPEYNLKIGYPGTSTQGPSGDFQKHFMYPLAVFQWNGLPDSVL